MTKDEYDDHISTRKTVQGELIIGMERAIAQIMSIQYQHSNKQSYSFREEVYATTQETSRNSGSSGTMYQWNPERVLR
jgi:hypothetical protein